jgi:hypothetical protein
MFLELESGCLVNVAIVSRIGKLRRDGRRDVYDLRDRQPRAPPRASLDARWVGTGSFPGAGVERAGAVRGFPSVRNFYGSPTSRRGSVR